MLYFLCIFFFFLFFNYKLERAFIFDRWRTFYSRAVLNAFSFLPAAPRDYVLESRMKCNREAEPVKKPRRQNLHYCPRDHLGNLGIHRSQSDFKIKRGRSKREQDGREQPPTKLRFTFSGTHLLLDCTLSSLSYSAYRVPPLFFVVARTYGGRGTRRGQRNIAQIKSHSRRESMSWSAVRKVEESIARWWLPPRREKDVEVEISHPQDYPELTN